MALNGGPEAGHLVRNISEHDLPRVLPSPGLRTVRIPRFLAHARFLRAGGCPVPSSARDAAARALLGARGARTVADQLAANESWCIVAFVGLAGTGYRWEARFDLKGPTNY